MYEVTMGIDPGSRTAGCAFLYLDDYVLKKVETFDLNTRKLFNNEIYHGMPLIDFDYKKRIDRMMLMIDRLITEKKPNTVVIETPFISMASASAFVPLFYFRVLFDKMMSSKYPSTVIIDKAPMSVKKHLKVSNKKKQGSKDSIREAIRTHPLFLDTGMLPDDINNLTEHEVDAIAICLAGQETRP